MARDGRHVSGTSAFRPLRRRAFYARDRYACVWCIRPITAANGTLDHIVTQREWFAMSPEQRAAFGSLHADTNVITACLTDNARRGARSARDYARDPRLPVGAWQRVRNARRRSLRAARLRVVSAIA